MLDSPVKWVRSPKKSTRFKALFFLTLAYLWIIESFASTDISVVASYAEERLLFLGLAISRF